MYLSRASIRTDTPLVAIKPVLLPPTPAARIGVSHRLMWTLFADRPDREQADFLWREASDNVFFIQSQRLPIDTHALFKLATKAVDFTFLAGQRIRFSLRANATIARKTREAPLGARGHRESIFTRVVRQLKQAGNDGPEARQRGFDAVARTWLDQQGDNMFKVESVSVEAEQTIKLDWRRDPVVFDAVDMTGVVAVADPIAFKDKLRAGFGRSKAFGCGLMLVKPA